MKRLLCFFVALSMVVSLGSMSVFAGAPEGASEGNEQTVDASAGGDSSTDPGAANPGAGGDSSANPGAGGGSANGGNGGGGNGKGGKSVSVSPLTVEETIIKEVSYAPEVTDRDLTDLYTGEDLPESLGDVTVAAGESWHVEDNCQVGKLEIEDGATVEADFPVIVFFEESSTIQNGDVIGSVQFVNDYDEIVAIVHTNDTHGELATEPYVKGLKDQLIDSGKYSLVMAVSCGDLFAGGNAVAHIYEGEFIPNVMNDIYDFMTWGNNDAVLTNKGLQTYLLSILGDATGMTTLLANQRASEDIDIAAYAQSNEPAVGAEVLVELYPEVLSLKEDGTVDYSALDLESYNLTAGDNALTDGAIVETTNGTKIGIFGVSTQGGAITDAYFSGGMSTVNTAQTLSDALSADGASCVVMIGHVGWMGPDSTETSSNDTNSVQLAMKTSGIDAIIDGHTHSVINDGEGYLVSGYGSNPTINQASCKGAAIGVLYLYLKNGEVVAKDCENLVPDENNTIAGIEPDAEVQATVDAAYDRLDADGYSTVWGTSEYFLNGERISSGDVGGGVRANETNLGDLVADSILYTAQKLWTDNEISIALYPGYWIRSSIEAGDITLIDALSVFANPLKIYYAEYTAAELVSKMNTSCEKIGEENNNMLMVSGLSCKFDPDTKEVVYLAVGDEVIYENGEYLVDDSWTVGCAAEVGGGDIDNCDDAMVFVPSNRDMAQYFCEFLGEADYTIYPDEMYAGGRVTPAE